jgi:KduI/IolB family
MKLIRADHQRRIEIAGVPEPVQRPVDIDRSQTGFANLRSLRIYRFDKDSVVNGHAEEDEVLIVMMAGSVELSMMEQKSGDSPRPLTLSAASDSQDDPCVAYLPPHGGYRLVARSDAEVAYARATPARGPKPQVFRSQPLRDHSGVTLLVEENEYPQRLRLRLLQVTATQKDISVLPIQRWEDRCEALVHVRTAPAEGVATIRQQGATVIPLASWDTVTALPGEFPALSFKAGSSALVLAVLAV